MPVSASVLDNLANATIDFYTDLSNNQNPYRQDLQARPFLDALRRGQEQFPGGKTYIECPIVTETTSTWQGFSYDDTVTYGNPDKLKRAKFSWAELHLGIEITESELKHNGIRVVDDQGGNTARITQAERIQLQDLMRYKMEDMMKGALDGLDRMAHQDGSQSAKEFAGLRSLIKDDPTAGTIGGIDLALAANAKFRNRSQVDLTGSGGADNRIDVTGGTKLTTFFKKELRQLTRFGGRPNLMIAGSTFLEKLEAERFANGDFTQTGWARTETGNIAMSDSRVGNVAFQYDPMMDDLGLDDRCYALDMRHVKMKVMPGYDFNRRNPDRPPEKYAIYRAINWTGTMTITQPNSCGVYQVK